MFSYSLILYVEAKLARVNNVTVGRNVPGEENGMSKFITMYFNARRDLEHNFKIQRF